MGRRQGGDKFSGAFGPRFFGLYFMLSYRRLPRPSYPGSSDLGPQSRPGQLPDSRRGWLGGPRSASMESSLMGGEHTPRKPSGTDVASLGPSDLSDSGSDVGMGALDPEALEGDSDSLGTGERATVDGHSPASGADILPDRLEGESAIELDGLQATLDFEIDQVAEQAEEAASRDMDHPLLDDTPADVGGLAQQDEDADPDNPDLDLDRRA